MDRTTIAEAATEAAVETTVLAEGMSMLENIVLIASLTTLESQVLHVSRNPLLIL